jgi:6-pyruvoyltetrahydropterin/6-carboxytetrahydropterin synthase
MMESLTIFATGRDSMMTEPRIGKMRTFLEFTVEAAHSVPGYSNLHGHTFVVKLTFTGEPDPTYGWVADLYAVKKIANSVKAEIGAGDETGDGLGEGNLCDIPDLRIGSLENFAKWIWGKVAPEQPTLEIVEVNRGFRGSIEGCEYRGSR